MELARELRNNLHPHPSAHSPYGNSTLSPGSQGLPPDSSVMALFNASATNTRQLLPLASYPSLWGSEVKSPRTYLPKQTFFTLYYRCKTETYLTFLLLPSVLSHPFRKHFCLLPFPLLLLRIPVLNPVFLLCPRWRRWLTQELRKKVSI